MSEDDDIVEGSIRGDETRGLKARLSNGSACFSASENSVNTSGGGSSSGMSTSKCDGMGKGTFLIFRERYITTKPITGTREKAST